MTEIRSATQRQRDKIRSGKIVERLLAHIQGKVDMSSTQIQAARILLNKTMPDIKALEVEHTGNINLTPVHRLTDEQLMAIASEGVIGQGTPEVIEGEIVPIPSKLKAAT